MQNNLSPVYIRAATALTTLGWHSHCDETSTTHNQVPIETFEGTFNYNAIANEPLIKDHHAILRILINVVEKALTESQIPAAQYNQTIVLLGSTSLDISAVTPDPNKAIWLSNTDYLSKEITRYFNLQAFDFTFNTACTASANAMLYGTRLLRDDLAKHAIVIGCEFYNKLTIDGFSSLDLISRDQVKSFSTQRDGLILGEGVAAVVLSREIGGVSKWQVLEGHSACDHHSLTVTEENGSHIASVIAQAMDNAQVTVDDVNLIKVHGTATIGNDIAEYNAIRAVFANTPNIIAFKPILGHTLGACGVIELAILQQLDKHNQMITPDYAKEKSDDLMLSFVQRPEQLQQAQITLLNHFGFGGNNAAMLIARVSA